MVRPCNARHSMPNNIRSCLVHQINELPVKHGTAPKRITHHQRFCDMSIKQSRLSAFASAYNDAKITQSCSRGDRRSYIMRLCGCFNTCWKRARIFDSGAPGNPCFVKKGGCLLTHDSAVFTTFEGTGIDFTIVPTKGLSSGNMYSSMDVHSLHLIKSNARLWAR